MNILLVQTGFLGDVILSTPVLSNLRRRHPEAKISVMTTPAASSLVRHHPAVREVIVFDKRGADSGISGTWRMAKRLQEGNFSRVYSLHKSYRTAILLRLAKIPERYGFREAKLSWMYTRTAPRKDLRHDVLRNLAIFRNHDIEPSRLDDELCLAIPAEAEKKADELLASTTAKLKIAIAPGSVWATKRWTAEGFAGVSRTLVNQGYAVYLLGGKDDEAVAKEVQSRAGVSLVNLAGKVDLLTSAAVIARCQLLIANDSAPLHLASAMKTPVVALFCATVPEFGFGPWKTPAEVLGVSGLSCRPCAKHGGKICPTRTLACQRDLTPEMVLQAAERLLQSQIMNTQIGHE